MLAHDLILAGSAEIVVAGGMESMSNAPYLLAKGARSGYRVGHDRIIDHMLFDGLEDAYEGGRSMGDFGEATAQVYQFSRAEQDAYAVQSLTRAKKAIDDGAFAAEIAPVSIAAKGGDKLIAHDENPLKVSPDKIPALKPAFRVDGTITAASSSANADGAAALILTRRSIALRDGLPILAEIRAHATHAQEPAWFTTAPIPAIRKLLAKTGWSVGDVDLFEINEAFAAAIRAMAACKTAISAFPPTGSTSSWRRLRARPSHRRDGRAADRHAAARARTPESHARRRGAVHRRRRSRRLLRSSARIEEAKMTVADRLTMKTGPAFSSASISASRKTAMGRASLPARRSMQHPRPHLRDESQRSR